MEELIVKSLDEVYDELTKGRTKGAKDKSKRKKRGWKSVSFDPHVDWGKPSINKKAVDKLLESKAAARAQKKRSYKKYGSIPTKKWAWQKSIDELDKGCGGSKEEKMHEVMHKFKKKTLHSGSKKGTVVQERDQAIAIGLSESGQTKKSIDDIQAEVIEKARTRGAKDKFKRRTHPQEYHGSQYNKVGHHLGTDVGMMNDWEHRFYKEHGEYPVTFAKIYPKSEEGYQEYAKDMKSYYAQSDQYRKSIEDVQSEVIEKARTKGAKDKLKRKSRYGHGIEEPYRAKLIAEHDEGKKLYGRIQRATKAGKIPRGFGKMFTMEHWDKHLKKIGY